LRRRGFTLETEGSDIRVRPSSSLTDEDRRLIRAHKPQLLALLVGAGGLGAVASEATEGPGPGGRPDRLGDRTEGANSGVVANFATTLRADLQEEFEERAAISQYDGRLTREAAEYIASLQVRKSPAE
jgi:hypothetical protein